MIIGIAGYAGSGKDTVRKILETKYGFQGLAFADPLRKALETLNPIVDVNRGEITRYTQAVEKVGYQAAKEKFSEMRRLLQVLGTEVGRDLFGPDVWVDALNVEWTKRGNPNLAISDMRFPNELDFVDDFGFSVWVERPGVGPVNAHVSDNGLKKTECDFWINNSGSLEDLESEVDAMLAKMEGW